MGDLEVCRADNTMRFDAVPVGARFSFRGHRYLKIARNMTRNEEGIGCIFMDETVVEPGAEEAVQTAEQQV